MKKIVLIVFVILLSVSLLGCVSEEQQGKITVNGEKAEETIISLVENFGSKLQLVSLLAPQEIVEKSIQENYGDFVTPELLTEWINDPTNAPGRLTSSPWPDHIEIINIIQVSEDAYEVEGQIMEVTGKEKVDNTGVAVSRPITLEVVNVDSSWLINKVTLGEYEEIVAVVYTNTDYGFSFSLPESWQEYKIITEEWKGTPAGSEEVVEYGPLISIRHPEWTSENPRQDIPIMIFTINQWNLLQEEKFHIGAAPMGPKELGRNEKYVFALPARYNYAFPTGFEEVEEILASNPLEPMK